LCFLANSLEQKYGIEIPLEQEYGVADLPEQEHGVADYCTLLFNPSFTPDVVVECTVVEHMQKRPIIQVLQAVRMSLR